MTDYRIHYRATDDGKTACGIAGQAPYVSTRGRFRRTIRPQLACPGCVTHTLTSATVDIELEQRDGGHLGTDPSRQVRRGSRTQRRKAQRAYAAAGPVVRSITTYNAIKEAHDE